MAEQMPGSSSACPDAETILSLLQAPVFWKDAERRFLGANQAFLEYFGLPDESVLIGRNDEDMGWHPEPELFKNDELRVLREGVRTTRVHTRCRARGELRDIVASKRPVYRDGRIVGLVGSFADVTEEYRRQAEISRLNDSLRETAGRNALLMESAKVCSAKLQLDENMPILEGFESLCLFTGYSEPEFLHLSGGTLRGYYARYATEFALLLSAVFKAREGGKTGVSLTLPMPTRRGLLSVRTVISFGGQNAGTGKARSCSCVFIDVTEVVETQRKLAAAEKASESATALKWENERLLRIIGNVPAGICVVLVKDGAPREVSINRHMARRLGLPEKESRLCSFADLTSGMHPDDRGRQEKDFRLFLQGHGRLEGNYRIQRNGSGDYVWAHVEGHLISTLGGMGVAYLAFTDITELLKTTTALKENRQLYENAVKSAHLFLWHYDLLQHRITMSGDETTRLECEKFAIPKVIDNVPESLGLFFDEPEFAKVRRMYEEVEQGKTASCEVWYKIRPGREPRCVRMTYTPVCDATGRVVQAYGFGQNITVEKKIAERYERELNVLRQNSDEHLLFKSRCNLTRNTVLEYTSKSGQPLPEQWSGTYDSLCQGLLASLYAGGDRNKLGVFIDRDRLLALYQQGETRSTFEYRSRNARKTLTWVSLAISMYMASPTGELECSMSAYDVTQKKLERQIFKRLTVLGYDELGVVYVATGACQIYRLKAGRQELFLEQSGSFDESLEAHLAAVPQKDRESVRRAMSLEAIVRKLDAEALYSVTSSVVARNGTMLQKLFQVAWLDENRDILFFCMSDITAQYMKEHRQIAALSAAKMEADRANQAKSSFLSSMSHDLRTPLNGILGFADVAIREQDFKKAKDYLVKIQSSGALLMELLNETLDLSRIESGKFVLELSDVDSREIGETVVTALRPSAELKGVHLDVSEFPVERVQTDRLKLQKIFLNLLSNAIKYTPAGGTVHVSIERIHDAQDDCDLRIVVEDNGIGMSQDFQKRLFEPFAQEHRPEAANVVGTGLGLSIVKKIVDLMGGRIAVQSRVSEGTRFSVELPVHLVMAGRPAQKAWKESESLAGRHVLLCEDNIVNTEIATLLLKERGMLVDCARNGKEGVESFSSSSPGHYAAILMDVRMPVMDGYRATRAIRALSRVDAKTVPIIAMTADCFEADKDAARKCGMDDVVTKPIEPAALYRALRENILRPAPETSTPGMNLCQKS